MIPPVIPRRVRSELMPLVRRYRRATARYRILPGFLIIGAPRAGTTTLFHHLRQHPDVAQPRGGDPAVAWIKELHFFDEKYWRGLDWYRSFFPLEAARRLARRRGGDLVAGEATPYYLFHPAVPERVAASLPDVRLVALLRDPIERAYSHYQLMVRTGREKHSFADAIALEEERLAARKEMGVGEAQGAHGDTGGRAHHHHRHRAYFGRGLYAGQLERWLAHFPREQLLVLRTEDMLERPGDVYAETLAFLGLRSWQPVGFEPRNVGSYAPVDPAVRAGLEQRYAEPNARLAELLGRDFGWSSASAAASASRRTA
jgi:hypothetical protein